MNDKKIWISSDLHLGHANIIKYCPDSRPFSNAEEMDNQIITNWNSVVGKDDYVYILGDVAFCNANKAKEKLDSMNGLKVLVAGNHDHKLKTQEPFISCFKFITDYMEVKFEDTNIVMFHYPIESWNGMYHGSIHLFGHRHGSPIKTVGKLKDVGLDTNNLFPYLLSDIIAKMMD
jgi:calcineurin-like phosphoesterase family protein